MVNIVHSSIMRYCPSFAIQNFSIVSSRKLSVPTVVRYIECRPPQRHCLNICLIGVTPIVLRRPVIAAFIIARPLVANIRTVLCHNGISSICTRIRRIACSRMCMFFLAASQIAPPIITTIPALVMRMFFLTTDHRGSRSIALIEVNGIYIPVIIDIDQCAAITGNRLLDQGMICAQMEAFARVVI